MSDVNHSDTSAPPITILNWRSPQPSVRYNNSRNQAGVNPQIIPVIPDIVDGGAV